MVFVITFCVHFRASPVSISRLLRLLLSTLNMLQLSLVNIRRTVSFVVKMIKLFDRRCILVKHAGEALRQRAKLVFRVLAGRDREN